MPKRLRRGLVVAALALALTVAVVATVLCGLSYQPDFYRALVASRSPGRQKKAERFVEQSLQLRNDIVNESQWEAVFSDEEVNAWLAEDLKASFADQIPPGFSEPRIRFDDDTVTLACQYEDGPVRSVLWAVLRVTIPHDNAVALTIEKLRVGALPVPTESVIEKITRHARAHGLDLSWSDDEGQPTAIIRYTPSARRHDVVLERVQLARGWIRLFGRSSPSAGVAVAPRLPSRQVIQSTFSRRRYQMRSSEPSPARSDVSLQRSS
jgi:hypothetical protein